MLDNDDDEDGDQLEITDVGNPSNGTAVAIDDDGDGVKDAISYTPSNSSDTVTFEYTISDGNGGTDTAEVTVNVTGDESSCGPLTVRVEDPNGNLVPGVGFEPKYDGDNDGQLEQLPKRGMATGKFTYPVEVDDDPSLSEMNENLLGEIPDGFATSVDRFDKNVEETASDQKEPDDFWYGNKFNRNKLKLATDPSSSTPPRTVTCYEDQDGDSYGNPGTDTERNSCQSGEVQNDNDCYDQNAEANPDQTSFFAEDRGDGSFDYNCDGASEKQYTKTYKYESCVRRDTGSGYDCKFDNPDNVSKGWEKSVPDCGKSGNYHTTVSCKGECPKGGTPPFDTGKRVWSTNSNTYSRNQSCR